MLSHANSVPTIIITAFVFFGSYWSFRFITTYLADNAPAVKITMLFYTVVILLFAVIYWSPLFFNPVIALAISTVLAEIAKANDKRQSKRIEERKVLDQTRQMLLNSDRHSIELDITDFDRKVVEKFIGEGSSEVWLHYSSKYHHNSGSTILTIHR